MDITIDITMWDEHCVKNIKVSWITSRSTQSMIKNVGRGSTVDYKTGY